MTAEIEYVPPEIEQIVPSNVKFDANRVAGREGYTKVVVTGKKIQGTDLYNEYVIQGFAGQKQEYNETYS